MMRHPTLKAYLSIFRADKNCRYAKHKKNDPRKIEKNGSIGGASIKRPEPMMKKYSIAAIVSQTPLKINTMANGFKLFFLIC